MMGWSDFKDELSWMNEVVSQDHPSWIEEEMFKNCVIENTVDED